jgi:hypothetical protein
MAGSYLSSQSPSTVSCLGSWEGMIQWAQVAIEPLPVFVCRAFLVERVEAIEVTRRTPIRKGAELQAGDASIVGT